MSPDERLEIHVKDNDIVDVEFDKNVLAAAFDEVLGVAQSLSENPGMTGRLSISYRSPTPLFQQLTLRGYVQKVEGRKIFTYGTLHKGDTLCAEAEGLFISMNPEVFERLMQSRTDIASRD